MKNKRALNTPFSNSEISAFCGQMALILKSGISSLEGISIMLEDAETEEDKAVLEKINEGLTMSGSLYTALNETGLFPQYMLQMTEIGEKTGTLDEVMGHLSTHYERENSIAKSIRSAVTYPLIMAAMLLVVIIVLLVRVMPIFNQVFIQLGTEMTGFSKALMDVGNIINRYAVVFIVIIIVIALGIVFLAKTAKGKKLMRNLRFKIPLLRGVHENTSACRFASGMALTLSSGLDTEQSMELAASLNDDPNFAKKMEACRKEIADGKDLYEAIHTSGIFSGIYARMASLGSRTGTMDRVMDKIASLYQDEVDNKMNNILSMLEPALVIALSLIVGVILLSVMLPLMGVMSGI